MAVFQNQKKTKPLTFKGRVFQIATRNYCIILTGRSHLEHELNTYF